MEAKEKLACMAKVQTTISPLRARISFEASALSFAEVEAIGYSPSTPYLPEDKLADHEHDHKALPQLATAETPQCTAESDFKQLERGW